MSRILTSLGCALLCACAAQAFEWNLGAGTNLTRRVADEPALRFPEGFKATVNFACDLDAIGARSAHANLLMKGKNFHTGYSIMVRKTGGLLVDILGIQPQYYICDDIRIVSKKAYLLEVYVTRANVRIFLDGVETGSYPYRGALAYSNDASPLTLGSAGGYAFTGSLKVKMEDIRDVTVPPGGPVLLAEAPREQPRATILWTKPICLEKDRYIGWPTVVCTRKGTLLAAFSGDRDAHICPWGKNQLVRSEDGGETWSAPQTVNNSVADDRDCGLLARANGEILLTWFSDHTWDQIEGFWTKDYKWDSPQYQWRKHAEKLDSAAVRAACGNWTAWSTDDGRTWSKPENRFVRQRGCPAAFAPHGPIELKDGSLVQVGRTAYREPEKRGLTRVTVSRSTDGGHTWEELCYAIPDSNGENAVKGMFHEPHAIELKDGRLLALVRYHGADHCLRQTVSSDGGRTWSPMTKTPMLGLPPHLLRLRDGRILCTYGRRHPQPTSYGEFACLSSDEGATWDIAHEIFLSAHSDSDLGYPSTAQLPNGDLVTVYYQPAKAGQKPCLMATKWRLK